MPDPEEIEYESPVAPITAPIPTPQPPLLTDAPGQAAPLTGRVVAMPDRKLFAQQQQDKSEAEYLRNVYQRSSNFDQAQKDVASARRMLGMMKADREIKAGVPVNEALFHNMQYFTQPGQAGFAPTMKALQPAPQGRVMPSAGGLPTGYIDPRGVPHWPSQSAMPKPAAETGPVQAAPVLLPDGQPDPHHVIVRSGNANKVISVKSKDEMNQLSPPQQRAALSTATLLTEKLLNSTTDSTKQKQYQKDLENYRQQIDDLIQPQKAGIRKAMESGKPLPDVIGRSPVVPPKANASERVRVRSRDGQTGTISRSALEEAKKSGYSVINAD